LWAAFGHWLALADWAGKQLQHSRESALGGSLGTAGNWASLRVADQIYLLYLNAFFASLAAFQFIGLSEAI